MSSAVRVVVVAFALLVSACSASPGYRAYPAGYRGAWDVDRARAAIGFAAARVGMRYCWGGTGPSCFDCSGLVQQAWASAGVRLPRTADAMAEALADVSLDDARAGDILWWPGHVGLYAGRGWMIDAHDRRDGIVERPLRRLPRRVLRP